MKIADLDVETKKVLVMAHVYLKFRTDENLARLTSAIKDFDTKHVKEHAHNLLRMLEECDTAKWQEEDGLKLMGDDDKVRRIAERMREVALLGDYVSSNRVDSWASQLLAAPPLAPGEQPPRICLCGVSEAQHHAILDGHAFAPTTPAQERASDDWVMRAEKLLAGLHPNARDAFEYDCDGTAANLLAVELAAAAKLAREEALEEAGGDKRRNADDANNL